jgi:hypothetical protein
MDEQALWYLSGAVDSLMNLRVQIVKKDDTSLGYRVGVELTLSRSKNDNPIFGLLADYCEQHNTYYQIHEGNKTYIFKVTSCTNIQKFLDPIIGGFLQQRERSEFFIENVIPVFQPSPPTTKEEIIEVAEVSERLNKLPSQSQTKYTADYFRDEWDMS